MKFSYDWLGELVPGLNTAPAELPRLITMKTAECEGIEPAGGDWIIEIDNKSLTHRPDLWGHVGMAREVAAITGHASRDPVKPELLPRGEGAVTVDIADFALCPRYSALRCDDVHIAESPAWLRARLEHLGLNPISNIVDLTNYILAELPQPMHAFDADKLAGNRITIRLARSGELLAALNGETYELSASDLVIADAAGPIALAGVIGGAASAISETTRNVIFESANFRASSVRLTSVRHKLRTDASMRFEKSLDPENTLRGLSRAVDLLDVLAPGAKVVGGATDSRGPVKPPPVISLAAGFVARKLGKALTPEEIIGILLALGFGVERQTPDLLSVTVPTWRATRDISVKDDLVEEIGRMVGYGEIVPTAPLVPSVVPPANPMRAYLRRLRGGITAQGFSEVYNYSFTNPAEAQRFALQLDERVAIANPIASEQTHLRPSLLPGLFRNLLTNVRHFQEFRLFEIGNEIHSEEIPHLAALLYRAEADETDFFEMKRVLDCLFPQVQLNPTQPRPYEHPFRTAEIEWDGSLIGRQFELHPSLLKAENIEGRAILFDVDLALAQGTAAARQFSYTPPRKFPTSGFDLSVVAKLNTTAASIEKRLSELAGDLLVSIRFVRQYSGPPLPEGEKSVSYRLEAGALDRTLKSEEVSAVRERVAEGMRAAGFDIRGLDS